MVKHYVEYLYPGNIINQTSVSEIPRRIVKNIKLSDDCIGFRFFDKTETVVDGETLTGKKKNVSGWYYRGEEMTLQQAKESCRKNCRAEFLLSSIEDLGYTTIVKTKSGDYLPLKAEDKVI